MKEKNIKVNAILNVTKTLMALLFPLVSYPYVLRVLNPDGVGKVAYVSSIVAYFSLVAMLGVSTYAVREGAKIRYDRDSFETFASQVFSINLLSTLVSLLSLVGIVFLVDSFFEYRLIFFVIGFSVIFQTFSIDWVNTIFEDFVFITIRTIFVYLLNIALLFLLVKKPDDYVVYAILTVVPSGVVCVSNWIYCRRYVHIRLIIPMLLRKHFKPLLILFANTVAISIYVNFDTTMIGWYKGDYYVGIYTVSAKVYHVLKTMLAAVYVVTIPRLSSFIGKKDYCRYKQLYSKTWGVISLLLIPVIAGLICFSNEVILAFGGEEYFEAKFPLQILSFALLFAIFGGLLTACLNVSIGCEKINLFATLIGASSNFVLNLFVIPAWGIIGAAVTTVIAEFLVFIICFFTIENRELYFDEKMIGTNLVHALIGALIVVVCSLSLKVIICSVFVRIAVIIPVCVLAYASFLIGIKNELFGSVVKWLFNRIKNG